MPTKVELDKGYSWVILVASFFYNVVEAGIFMSPAVYMVEWLQVYETSKAKVGLVGSLMSGMAYLMGIFVGPLVDRFNCRLVSYMGLSLIVLGFIGSAFAPSINWLLVTYGLFIGSGEGLMAIQSILIVQYYFEKKRPFASGISTVGHSMGTVTMLPLASLFIQFFGIKGALILHAGITMQNIVLASLFRPIDVKAMDQEYKERSTKEGNSHSATAQEIQIEKKTAQSKPANYTKDEGRIQRMLKIWDFSLFKERVYIQFLSAIVLQEFGIAVMYRFTSVKAVADGVTAMKASFLPSITGMCAIASRIISSVVANLPCVNRTLLCGVAAFMQGIIIMTSCIAWDFQTYAVFMALYGLCMGSQFAVHTTVLTDLIGVARLAQGSSFLSVFIGISLFASFPIAGWIIDTTGNYDISYYIFGSITCISGLLIATIPFLYKIKHENLAQKEEASRNRIDTPVFLSIDSLHKMQT